jgi:hypothetical protein
MEQSTYRGVTVALGGTIGSVATGCMFALPVFLISMAAVTIYRLEGLAGLFGRVGFGVFAIASLFRPFPKSAPTLTAQFS